jgi:Tol biopolymer transport system component
MRPLVSAVCVSLLTAASLFSQETDFPVLRGPYCGQKPPGTTPEVFAPGVISTPVHEFACSFSPDGREFYFTRLEPSLNQRVIMMTCVRDGVWTKPIVVPFVENQFSFEPMVTPDGSRLYFTSGKPIPGQPGPPMNILYVDREGEGWTAAKNPGPPFNPAQTMYISMTRGGTIYTTDISEGPGRERIAMMKRVDGQYQKLERLGPPINGDTSVMYPFIAPDESYLLFSRRRPQAAIKSILLVAFRNADNTWSQPKPLDLGITAGTPYVSPDGKFLFFTGGEQGRSDLYWVSADVFEKLRPNRE